MVVAVEGYKVWDENGRNLFEIITWNKRMKFDIFNIYFN